MKLLFLGFCLFIALFGENVSAQKHKVSILVLIIVYLFLFDLYFFFKLITRNQNLFVFSTYPTPKMFILAITQLHITLQILQITTHEI